MRSKLSTTPNWSDDDLRLKRVAHGTRAVAAAVIVGGIVIAAIESAPTSNRFHALDATSAATEFSTGESATGAAASAVPEVQETDPALQRVDQAVEHRG